MSENAELTVLVYNASDNPLAPLLVSELKAIKDAGFQQHTNVIVYFDPMAKGIPTRVYDVNRKRKDSFKRRFPNDPELQDRIGDGRDSFVRKFREDQIPNDKLTRAMIGTSAGADDAATSLTNFVKFGIEKFKAEKYILFLVGHGMIIGNDAFLPDEDPVSAITLKDLKLVLENFTSNGTTSLSLLYLHSCSMSSLEVVYQLRGQADYMIATQGPTFVNSVPFRQILKKMLNQVKEVKDNARKKAGVARQNVEQAVNGARVDMNELVRKVFYHSMHNNTDFISVGYSADLVLCDLNREKAERMKKPLQDLVGRLKEHLTPRVSLIKDLILLSHWESQSFYSENYTDLHDFCDCLARRCSDQMLVFADNEPVKAELEKLANECDAVKSAIIGESEGGLVIREENHGTRHPFARGLSVYFPWCEPLEDQRANVKLRKKQRQTPPTNDPPEEGNIMSNYNKYDFNEDLKPHSWGSFLETYFSKTKREEEPTADLFDAKAANMPAFTAIEKAFHEGVSLFKRTPELKRTPEVGSRTPEEGVDCDCPSIKNYPTDPKRNTRQFTITRGAFKAFNDDSDDV